MSSGEGAFRVVDYNNWRKWCKRKCHVLFFQKDLWLIKFTWEMTKEACVIHWMGQFDSWASPQIIMPKCANHNKLATLHLEYVNCPIFLTTYMQRFFLKLWGCLNIELNSWCEHKGHFYMNIIFKHLWCACKVCIEVATIDWSECPLTWAPNTTKACHFPLGHILTHFYKLHDSCVYV